jgi:hypothetical protein
VALSLRDFASRVQLQTACDCVHEPAWARPYHLLAETVEQYRNGSIMHPSMSDDYKPMVFRGGRRVAFPQPTKPIQLPTRKGA